MKLHLTLCSFSYRTGIPDDPSGNGGGYVFDCRCLTNPGRLTEYKSLTGQDEAVILYLQKYSEADRFIENAFQLISQSLRAYQQRGYTHLQVSFGCTDGQHRSVYCAETLASKIKTSFDITLTIEHRAKSTWPR